MMLCWMRVCINRYYNSDVINLQMNDFVRDKTTHADGTLPIYMEMFSGACVSIGVLSCVLT